MGSEMAVVESPQVIVPTSSFLREVEEVSGEKVATCFQCERCTNGCPVTFAMDIVPHKLIHMIHIGLRNQVLEGNTMWVCAACEACTTRCPNDIDIAHMMDSLRQIAERTGVEIAEKQIPVFHSIFLSTIEKHGRLYELGLTMRLTLKNRKSMGDLLQDAKLGWEMFKRGRLGLLPHNIRATKKVQDIFRRSEGSR